MEQETYIDNLPVEMLGEIVIFLEPKDLISIYEACKPLSNLLMTSVFFENRYSQGLMKFVPHNNIAQNDIITNLNDLVSAHYTIEKTKVLVDEYTKGCSGIFFNLTLEQVRKYFDIVSYYDVISTMYNDVNYSYDPIYYYLKNHHNGWRLVLYGRAWMIIKIETDVYKLIISLLYDKVEFVDWDKRPSQ